MRGGAAPGQTEPAFGGAPHWSDRIPLPWTPCPWLCQRERPRLFLPLIERGNLPNCRLNSNTLTTCKVWRPMTFRPVRPLYLPAGASFSLLLCRQPSLPSKAVSALGHTILSIYLRFLALQMSYPLLGQRASGLCSRNHPDAVLTFTMRKQAGSLGDGARSDPVSCRV